MRRCETDNNTCWFDLAVNHTPPPYTPRKRREPPASGSDSEGDRLSKSPPEKKRKGKHGKQASVPVQNGDSNVGKTDFKAWSFSEKRALPKTDYNETTAHCPLPGCDSKGQLLFWEGGEDLVALSYSVLC